MRRSTRAAGRSRRGRLCGSRRRPRARNARSTSSTSRPGRCCAITARMLATYSTTTSGTVTRNRFRKLRRSTRSKTDPRMRSPFVAVEVQRRKPPAGSGLRHVLDRVEGQLVDVCRCVVVGARDHATVRREHPAELGQGPRLVGDVVEHPERQDHIERRGPERQLGRGRRGSGAVRDTSPTPRPAFPARGRAPPRARDAVALHRPRSRCRIPHRGRATRPASRTGPSVAAGPASRRGSRRAASAI